MIYIINDLELLQRLSKHKILEYLMCQCLAVTAIRLNDYSFGVRQLIKTKPDIKVLQVDNAFDTWIAGKRKYLSVSDLSSMYVAHINEDATLVLSLEDQPLINEAKSNHIAFMQFDSFIINLIKDERIIQLYNLIKVA